MLRHPARTYRRRHTHRSVSNTGAVMDARAWIRTVAVAIGLAGAAAVSPAPVAAAPLPPVAENLVGAAWGSNSNGQLGTASSYDRTTPVDIFKLGGVSLVRAGRLHSLAVMLDGTLRAWGWNGHGQLGLGTW